MDADENTDMPLKRNATGAETPHLGLSPLAKPSK